MKNEEIVSYRGYVIINEPQGDEPFTIYGPDRELVKHCDEATIEECMATIDEIEEGKESRVRAARSDDWYPGSYFSKKGGYPETY